MRKHKECVAGCGKEVPWGGPKKENGKIVNEFIYVKNQPWCWDCWNSFITKERERIEFLRRVA